MADKIRNIAPVSTLQDKVVVITGEFGRLLKGEGKRYRSWSS